MRRLLPLLLLAGLAACSQPSPYENVTVSGRVVFPATALGPDAETSVFLTDLSGPEPRLEVEVEKLYAMDPGAELTLAQTIEGTTTSPVPFSLEVPMAKIDTGHDYGLTAAVTEQGRIVLGANRPTLVLTKGRPTTADVVLSAWPQ
jgi:uncharacterized lipoprotein YbaY